MGGEVCLGKSALCVPTLATHGGIGANRRGIGKTFNIHSSFHPSFIPLLIPSASVKVHFTQSTVLGTEDMCQDAQLARLCSGHDDTSLSLTVRSTGAHVSNAQQRPWLEAGSQ